MGGVRLGVWGVVLVVCKCVGVWGVVLCRVCVCDQLIFLQVLLRVLEQQKRMLRELDASINRIICIGIHICIYAYVYIYMYSAHPLFTPPFTGAVAGPQSAEAVASRTRRIHK